MKRLLFLSSLFVVLVVSSNFMAVKTIDVGGIILPSAVICYPFVFALGDVINEYFGFKTTRSVILMTFCFDAVAIGFLTVAALLPPSPYFGFDQGFRAIFLSAPRILIASFTAFLVSSVLDSYVFSKIKRAGSLLVVRSAVSSVLGIIIDSCIFIFGAFAFTAGMPLDAILTMTLFQILAKLIFGVLIGTPAVLAVVKLLPPLSDKDREYWGEGGEANEVSPKGDKWLRQ